MSSPPTLQLDVDYFLQQHWQQQHCFLPQGMANFVLPAGADELAGLALEDDVDSQIVRGSGLEWRGEKGPFSVEDLQRDGAWTLLVQCVDRHWDEAASLMGSVPFIPDWRCDDIMMSYASDGGSAGPHYDNYDVFIIQGEGERRWQLGQQCDASTPLLPCDGLKLVANFKTEYEYTLTQGDVLYIPPGTAHFGTSIGESTSISIGFRAPRLDALLARWTDAVLAKASAEQLYRDAGRSKALAAGQIDELDVQRAREQLLTLLEKLDAREFGEVVTETNHDFDVDSYSPVDFELSTQASVNLARIGGSRLAWHQQDSEFTVFANGTSKRFPIDLQSLVIRFCDMTAVFNVELESAPTVDLVRWLFEQGVLIDHE